MNDFGPKLRELREAANLTQPQLAERAGLKKAGIANLEQGRREPAWATVQALCKALGVSCEAFNVEPTTSAKPRGRGRPAKSTATEKPAPKRAKKKPSR